LFPRDTRTDLPKLEHIYLSNDVVGGASRIVGTIPDAIGKLTHLKCLYLSHAGKMTGTLPASMANLAELQALEIRWTHFEGALPDLSRASNLTKVVIDSSPAGGLCPPACKNYFNGTLDALASWKNQIQHLDVAGNQFSGVFPSALCAIKDCTAWGNHFAKPKRPKGCCAGLSSSRDNSSLSWDKPVGYVCHPHDFPGSI
jgi:hypothetical protein